MCWQMIMHDCLFLIKYGYIAERMGELCFEEYKLWLMGQKE